MVPSCMRGLPFFLVLSHLGLIIHYRGRTNMSISNKGRSIYSLYTNAHPKNSHIYAILST